PTHRFGIGIVLGKEGFDRGDQRGHVVMAPALDLALGEQSKPTFDLVEPRSVGRSEVEMEPWALQQPAMHERRLMGGVVVEHQMDLEFGRDTLVEQIQKGAELLAAMLGKTAPDDLAGGDVQRRKKAGHSVPKVIWRAALDRPGGQGQNRLCTAQG